MNNVRNNRELRLAYEVLQILTEYADHFGESEKRTRTVIETKQAIRRFTHRKADSDRRIIRDDGMDGYVSLERLPDSIRSLDEAIDFFEECRTYQYRPSAYDCTGQAMTNWFKVFPRNGGFYAYHSVSFDV